MREALRALVEGGKGDEAARWIAEFQAVVLAVHPAPAARDLLQPKAIADAGEDCARQAFVLNPNKVTAARLVPELYLESGRATLTALALEVEYGLRG
jgi:hypothetical protein